MNILITVSIQRIRIPLSGSLIKRWTFSGIKITELIISLVAEYNSKNTHGTGCTLSSAITTHLSCGKDLIKSCELGIKYVNDAIKTNTNLGKGNGPINHLNSIILNKKFK